MSAPIDLSVLEALIAENETIAGHLREKAIPHQVGMAAACRVLAVELPRTLGQRVASDLTSGVLAERWRVARNAAATPVASEPAEEVVVGEAVAGEAEAVDAHEDLDAIAGLLRAQLRAVARYLGERDKAWTAEAYRLEGQATALESQVEHLRRLVAPTSSSAPTDDAVPVVDGASADATAHRAPSGAEG